MKKYSLFRYRLGLIAAVCVSLGLFATILHQAQLNKQDELIRKTADNIENDLSNYVYDKQLVPESLAAAGIKKVPPYITYKKLTTKSYRFCVTYKGSRLGGYQAGKTCHSPTVYLTPPPAFVKNSDNTYTVCGVQAGYYGGEGYIVPPTINIPNVVDISNQIYMFSAESKAFDEQCDELKRSDLKVGDRVDVFDRLSSTNTTPAVSTFLKRS